MAARQTLPIEAQGRVLLRLGSVWATTDSARAVGYAKQALKIARELGQPSMIGDSHQLLGRLYRRIGETYFARDHFLQAQAEHRRARNQPALIKDHISLGTIQATEGDPAEAHLSFTQASTILGQLNKYDEPFLRGQLKLSCALLVGLQGKLPESVALLEQAIACFERARLPRPLAIGYSNLGFMLLQLGDARRARAALETALAGAQVCGARLVEASMQETLAELFMLQGDFAAAEALLERSITALRTLRSGFNEAQAQLTLGRYRLLASESARASRLAAEAFRASQEICARIGDRRGQMAARLWLVETHLVLNEMAKARRLLEKIRAEIEAPIGRAHLPLLGHLCELKGRIALSEGRIAEAIRCLDQAVSICELTGHRYRAGVAGFHLSRAYLEAGQVTRAREVIEQAAVIFSEMEAQPMLAQTAALRFEESQVRTTRIHQPSAAEIALSGLTRLAEAGHSQELLLHELARLLDRDFSATPVIIYQRLADGRLIPIFYQGCDEQQAISLGKHLKKVKSGKLKSGQSAAPAGSLYQLVEDDTLMLYLGEHSAELSSSLVALLNHQIRLALEVSRLRPRTPSLPAYPSLPSSLLPSLPDLICQSTSMRRVAEQVLELQGSHLTVLITGQSGTGKELIARAIHDLSSRAAQPFIAFNCASTPRELVEAQLFGYRKGAFTGANQDHPGMIRAAAGGTLLLDEIGDLPRDIQLKLLRFLQEGEIQPLGESRPARVDVRVIAATNRDLERMIAAGEFREDLWYRLNVVELHLPPLRERREEIPLLIEHFLNRYTAKAGKEGITVAPEALEVMMQYDWPGNVRQLENEIQRLVALKPAGTEITAQQLNPRITKQVAAVSASSQHKTLAEIEREAVLAAMTRHRGNRTRVAEELGISRPTLRAMIERHKIVLPPKLKQ